jgi:hypothetical protein
VIIDESKNKVCEFRQNGAVHEEVIQEVEKDSLPVCERVIRGDEKDAPPDDEGESVGKGNAEVAHINDIPTKYGQDTHIHKHYIDGYSGSQMFIEGGLNRSDAGDTPLLSVSPNASSAPSPSKVNISVDELEIPIVVRTCLQESHGAHKGHLGFEGTVRNQFNLRPEGSRLFIEI